VGTSTSLSYQSMNLTAGTVQNYRVLAYDSNGNVSALTSTISTTTLAQSVTPTPAPTPTPVPPPAPSPTPSPTPTPAAGTREWGAFIPGGSANDLTTFETLVGKSVDIRAVFIGWGHSDDFPSWLSAPLKASNKTLLLYWQTAANYDSSNVNQPSYNYDSIIAGNWDSYLRTFAQSVKAYGGPVILLPFEEMNGDWYPWSGTLNGNTPAKHITAWRRVVDIIRAEGATNAKFAWSPNSTSWPNTTANDLTQYYPGDAWVDYVGLDGFNFGNPWQSFSQVFDTAITKVKAYNKPIYIFSTASAEGTQKAAWITDALTVQIPKYPEIKGFIWFNENKEQNWLVDSSQAALTAFKNALSGY
jgi:beta-mannanase